MLYLLCSIFWFRLLSGTLNQSQVAQRNRWEDMHPERMQLEAKR